MKQVHALLALALVIALLVTAPAASAQEPPSTGMTTQDIIPKPNSGHAPTEAGDRGGALQLLLPALLAAAIGGGALHLRRQSRRARADAESS
jgi:uncharacterized protein HemX